MKKHSEQGSVLIGVIMSLSLAGFLYVLSSTSFFKSVTRQKSKTEIDVLSKALNNAVFNYTSYAIKERWCMDKSWGRDVKCSDMTDLKDFVTHPRNLERFLWSRSTINDMSSRYQIKYGVAPNELSLKKLEHVVTMSSLESLGVSHPLNLVTDDKIKECLSAIQISIEKPLSSYYRSQGDEVYLIITVKGILSKNLLNRRCSLIKNTPVVSGLVIVYPKTLNQYALIKTGDFKISDYPDSQVGLNFYGPVYVQKNVKLPANSKHSVSFKEKVTIGEGIVLLNGKAFSPKTPGGFSDQYLSQIKTMNGFMNGISLEAEADLGIPKLFGENYTYPPNSNISQCTSRKRLKDNFTDTKDSRLWIKGRDGDFSFALSMGNEFREYTRHGSNDNGKFIYNKLKNSFDEKPKNVKKTYKVEVKDEPESSKPIMEAHISVNGSEFSTLYLGRNTESKIVFGDKVFFQDQKNILDTSNSTYLEISKIDKDGLGINNDLKNVYNNFENACNSAKASNVGIPECKKVMQNSIEIETDCSSLPQPSDVASCETKLNSLKKQKTKYFDVHNELVNNLNGFISNPPSVTINTSEILSNKEDVKIIWDNKDSFKYPFVSRINDIKVKFNVYDFAIEESNNTISGSRDGKKKRLPGPNGNGVGEENSMIFDISRNPNGTVRKFETKKSDNSILNANDEKGTTLQSWSNNFFNQEPPGNGYYSNRISYPEDGITVAEAKRLDSECDVDTTALPPAKWDISFTEKTQFSWLYNVTNSGINITNPSLVKPMPLYTFSKLDMDPGSYQGVPTRSIVKDCVVPNAVEFIFGFYVCENLIIESRSTPLNLVGTFIVKNLKITKNGLDYGINFYSIWSSGGIELLRTHKHLRRERAAVQDCIFDKPGWFQGLNEDDLADYQSCSPAKFLYQGANNFNWTTIDPEIGITSDVGQVVTQSKIANRYLRYGMSVVWLKSGFE